MDNFINWFKDNWAAISLGINAFITFASVIVGLTKTDKDDKYLNIFIKFLDVFSVVNPKGTVTKRIDDKVNNDGK